MVVGVIFCANSRVYKIWQDAVPITKNKYAPFSEMKIMHRSIPITFTLLILISLNLYAEESVNKIRIDSHSFFKSEHITGSSYIHLAPNGNYRRIQREHMFVEENDAGEWFQDKNGQITLKSKSHFKNIEAGPLYISMWWPENANRIPFIKHELKKLLQQKRDSFTSEEIEDIEKWGYQNSIPRINVDFTIKVINRIQLEYLYSKIEEFEHDKNKNYFIITPIRYKKTTFLLQHNFGTSPCRELESIKEEIDKLEGDSQLLYVYQAIDKQTFENEAETTQEFIFYPDMTEKVRKLIKSNEN